MGVGGGVGLTWPLLARSLALRQLLYETLHRGVLHVPHKFMVHLQDENSSVGRDNSLCFHSPENCTKHEYRDKNFSWKQLNFEKYRKYIYIYKEIYIYI